MSTTSPIKWAGLQNYRATPLSLAPLEIGQQAQGSNQRSTAPLHKKFKVPESHAEREIIPHTNLWRQKTSCNLWCPTPRNLKLIWMSCSSSGSIIYTLTGRSSTPYRQCLWLLWILYNIHSPAKQRRWFRGIRSDLHKAYRDHMCMYLELKKPNVTVGSRTQNRRTVLKDREDEGIVTVHKDRED